MRAKFQSKSMSQLKHKNFRYKLPLAILATYVVACSVATEHNVMQSELDSTLSEAKRVAIDPEIEQQSSAMQNFLVGQIAIGQEDFDRARNSFEQAEKLSKARSPYLDARLAELYLETAELDSALKQTELAISSSAPDVNLLLLHAGLLEAHNKNEEAIPVYERALALDSNSSKAAVLLAAAYLRRGEDVRAISLLLKFNHSPKHENLVVFYLARAYEHHHELIQAEKVLREALAPSYSESDLSVELIRILVKQRHVPALEELCKRLLLVNQEDAAAAAVLEQLNRTHEISESLVSQLVVQQDTPSETRLRVAIAAIEHQSFSEASQELRLILAQRPDFSEARFFQASVLASLGRKEDAVKELNQISEKDAMYIKAKTFAAFILRQDGKNDQAEQAIRDALKVAPKDRHILIYLVSILRDTNRTSEAADLLKQAVEQDPEDVRLLFNYSVLLDELSKREQAREVMEQVLKLDPKHTDAMNYIAYELSEEGADLERAEELIKTALSLRPNDPYYIDTLGWIQFRRGQFGQAVTTLQHAITITSDDAVLLLHFAEALIQDKQEAHALEVLKSAADKKFDDSDPRQRERRDRIKQLIEELESRLGTPQSSMQYNLDTLSGRV